MPTVRTRSTDLALISASLRGGGAERVMAILANECSARGLGVDMVLVQRTGQYLQNLSPSVNVLDLGASRAVGALPALVRYLRRANPKAILATQTHVNLVCLLAHTIARARGKLVLREANTLSRASKGSRRLKDRVLPSLAGLLYRRADHIVAVSHGVAEDLRLYSQLDLDKISVIYNPLLTPDIPELAKQEPSHSWLREKSLPVILGIGRLTPQKNFALLIQAFGRLHRRLDARLVILGEGEDRASLEASVEGLGLSESVSMPGFVDNPFAYLSRADAFVLSSSWEGLPGVLIQALAVGIPVVSTDCPSGPKEILDGGAIGRLVPMGDAEALSMGMLDAIQGRLSPPPDRWMEQFKPEHVVDCYLAVLGLH